MDKTNETGEMVVVNTTTPTTINNSFDIVNVEEAQAFMENYQELVNALLVETDYQQIGDKKAKKKSAWRKLATAFNITDTIVNEEIERDENNQIVSAKYYVQATLPNGRSSIGVGACSIYDKIRYKGTPSRPADKDTPSNFILRGRFSNAEHDVPSTAHTRAKSRAISDLIGAGEVSAEEMSDSNLSNGNGTRRKRKRIIKPNEAPKKPEQETKTEEVVVEAEIVQNTPSKEKKTTLKELIDNNPAIREATDKLQEEKQSITRAGIIDKLLDMQEHGHISLDEYKELKAQLAD